MSEWVKNMANNGIQIAWIDDHVYQLDPSIHGATNFGVITFLAKDGKQKAAECTWKREIN